jgi:lysophospholipase L1-like esterase
MGTPVLQLGSLCMMDSLAVTPWMEAYACIRRVFAVTVALVSLVAHADTPSVVQWPVDEDLYRSCPQARWPTPDANLTMTLSEGTPYTPWQQTSKTLLPVRQARRVGIWGDSHTASGDFLSSALQQWGIDKNHVRPGLIPPAFQVSGVRLPFKKHCLSAGWKTVSAHREFKQGGAFTQTLLQLRSDTSGDMVWMDFRFPHDAVRLTQLQVHASRQEADRPWVIAVSVDNQSEHYYKAGSDLSSILQIQASRPFATVRLRVVSGQLNILGFEPVFAEPPGLIVDTFSTPGATAKVWSDIKPVIVGKPYDTVLFEYGTNEAMASDFNEKEYATALRQNLSKFRSLHPKARCVLIGPPERGGMSNLPSIPYTQVHQTISQVQARVAKEQGCHAWNWQSSLQAVGTVGQLQSATPPLMGGDRVHLTKEGYEAGGRAFAKMTPWKD